jgi:threonine synthase
VRKVEFFIFVGIGIYCAANINWSQWNDQMILAVGLGTNGLAAWQAFWRA